VNCFFHPYPNLILEPLQFVIEEIMFM